MIGIGAAMWIPAYLLRRAELRSPLRRIAASGNLIRLTFNTASVAYQGLSFPEQKENPTQPPWVLNGSLGHTCYSRAKNVLL